MNELEEKYYSNIKEELVQSVIDKKIDTYFTDRNELSHYYNVGKMIVDAQGGEERAKYGNGLIRKYSLRLTRELNKGYSYRTLNLMRKYYLFQKVQPVVAQSISWSHYTILMSLKDINEINYYIEQIETYHWGKRTLQEKIKSHEYQRLGDETKNKLVNKEEIDVTSYIKNPIYINTFNSDKENISENTLKSFILRDMENFLKQLGKGFLQQSLKKMRRFYLHFQKRPPVAVQFLSWSHYEILLTIKDIDDKYLIEYSSNSRIKITTYELV